MTKSLLLLIPALLLICSCENDDSYPRIDETTHGEKWTLRIGSSHADVYTQLQQLSTEKNFSAVAIVYRKPLSKPEGIQNFLPYYNAITVQSNSGVIDRALIEFDHDKVTSIETGSAMLNSATAWPQNTSDDAAIHVNDPVGEIYNKILAIYQMPSYSSYQIILPDKPLGLPFDPDMVNYDEWAFDFSQRISGDEVGRSSVRLFFSHGKLVKIRDEYDVNRVLIDPGR
ncbi:MAG TPA: hypothetical protein VHO90_11245 [Bacteroidales bacterium]|nr:hypothetical protein [Bacteroidales bacterium]